MTAEEGQEVEESLEDRLQALEAERDEYLGDLQRVAAEFGKKDPRTPFGQPGVDKLAGYRIRERLAHAPKEPVMVEEDEVDPDTGVARNLEAGVDIGKELLIEPARQAAVVEDNSGATVAEQEPPDDDEPETRHLVEIAGDCIAACRNAQMRSPDVGAEVEAVEDGCPVSGPGVVAAVNEHWFVVSGSWFLGNVWG